jgi:hypothetical protein
MTSMDSTPNLLPLCLENPKNFGVKDPGSASIYGFFLWSRLPAMMIPKGDPMFTSNQWIQNDTKVTLDGEAWFFLRHFFFD